MSAGRSNRGVRGAGRDLEAGLTLIEVTLMLLVTIALVGALTPSIAATVRHAEAAAATTSMTAIQLQLLAALNDMSYSDFTRDGVKNSTAVELLVGDGDIPRDLAATGSAEWQRPVDNATGLVDFLERHLVTNNPRGNAANAYAPPGNSGAWRGAYLDGPIDPDPWGNRFAVNAEFFGNATPDVVVYSAGPDEQIDGAYSGNPLVAVDDDLLVLVEP
jgi:hypothetical protein